MKNQHADRSGLKGPAKAKSPRSGAKVVSALTPVPVRLLERWRRLATGLRGVRLFRVSMPVGGGVFWEAECTLNGASVSRRFASELHARAWLSVATQPRILLSSVERQELNRPCSGSCFATGG